MFVGGSRGESYNLADAALRGYISKKLQVLPKPLLALYPEKLSPHSFFAISCFLDLFYEFTLFTQEARHEACGDGWARTTVQGTHRETAFTG